MQGSGGGASRIEALVHQREPSSRQWDELEAALSRCKKHLLWNHEGLRDINEFAEAEHTEMVILMWETGTMAVLKRQGWHQTTGRVHQFQNFIPW